jgi:hypothetical protein
MGLDNLKELSATTEPFGMCAFPRLSMSLSAQAIKHVHVRNTCYKTHKAPQQLSHYSELGYDSDDGPQTALSRPTAALRHIQSPAQWVR